MEILVKSGHQLLIILLIKRLDLITLRYNKNRTKNIITISKIHLFPLFFFNLYLPTYQYSFFQPRNIIKSNIIVILLLLNSFRSSNPSVQTFSFRKIRTRNLPPRYVTLSLSLSLFHTQFSRYDSADRVWHLGRT